MTSKEALSRIKERYVGVVEGLTKGNCSELCASITVDGVTYKFCPKEELDAIEKDLEVLDILKPYIGEYYNGEIKMVPITKTQVPIRKYSMVEALNHEGEEYEIVKEWLRNE